MTLRSAPFWWVACDYDGCDARCPDDHDETVAWSDADQAGQCADDSEWFAQLLVPVTGYYAHWCPEHWHTCEARESWEDARRRGAAADCTECTDCKTAVNT